MRFFPERMAVLAWFALLTACATGGRASSGAARGGAEAAIAGDWEGVVKTTLGDGIGAGDTRIERHAWRLVQGGGQVRGYYVVELTMISGDGRPYLCSRAPRFSTLLRFDVRGRVAGPLVELEEVGDPRAKGACQPAARSPSRYRAAVRGDVLTLVDGPRRVVLRRRTGAATADGLESPLLAFAAAETADATPPLEPATAGFAGLETALRGGNGEPAVNLEGLWVWERRGALPGGDEKLEREEWHLVQEGSKLTGYYDRAVRQISTDGHAYRCNSALDFRVVTRYQITGEVRGTSVALYERAFEIIEGSPCDDGRRRLDAYHGLAGPAEIRLMWGVGTQVLRRSRPNVPTQRF